MRQIITLYHVPYPIIHSRVLCRKRYKQGGFLDDFKEAARLIGLEVPVTPEDAGVIANKLAIIELLNVYSFQNLVDIFGNVPYSQALDINNITPAYDDAATIYSDLLSRIDAALGSS